MIQFSKEVASAQNDAYKRIVLDNAGMLAADSAAEDAQINVMHLREWWGKSYSAFHQVRTILCEPSCTTTD
jgi:hypothetical protein